MKTFEQLMDSISAVKEAEKVTKAVLGELSRDLLSYMLETSDIRPVNRLLGKDGEQWILTPINWRIAVQYFSYYLPWKSNYNDEVKEFAIKGKGARTPLVFTKKNPKTFDKKVEEIGAWLEIDTNDLWVWSNNATIEAKPVDYALKITKAVEAALDEEKGGMSMLDVMTAVANVDGVDADTMFKALQVAFAAKEPEQEAA